MPASERAVFGVEALMSVHVQLEARHRWSDAGRGVVALVGVLVLVVAVPVALIAWVGWPLPAEVPSPSEVASALRRDTYIPDSFLVKALALVCWLVWIELVASLLVEAVAYARGRKAGAVPLAGGLQRGAARLVATVALLGALLATKGMPGSGGQAVRPLAPAAMRPITTLVVDDAPEQRVAELGRTVGEALASVSASASAPVYEVQHRDTLWDIAERHLGDPFRWQEIFHINQGRVQPDGRCLTDPDVIRPGWRLALPDDARGLRPPVPPAAPTPPPPADPPPAAPSVSTDDGMVLLDDGNGDRDVGSPDLLVADAAGSWSAGESEGMVLLPDLADLPDLPDSPGGRWDGSPADTTRHQGDQFAAGDDQ